ncbi:alpha/beta hydrolase [Nitratireductor mangrovi]|uniref:Alpha/beta hydrolase n=1 Tax=Nitratireductor mangrovi TaxID=2599600 RepID=A0A5B8L1X3_9HYPH|nr:alpha/beta hydrolase [Nitratireductor mangrovi]QDZ02007.1 alpha/beta hydrolase [Nitratireductor mangrovi]
MLKIALRLVLLLLIVAVAALAGLRGWATLRERADPGTAAGAGATFVTVDGLPIHYREWGKTDGRPLVLVHGTMAWAETWRDIAGPLADAGFRVIAPDLPPFGFSRRPADGDYSRTAQARRLLGFADVLGLDRFALAGHSFGGGATIEAAFAAPERVEVLALLDVAIGLGRPHSGPPLAPLFGVGWLRDAAIAATFTNPWMTGKGLRDFIHDDAIVTAERIALYQRPLVVAGTTTAVGDWFLSGLFGNESGARSADPAAYGGFAPPVLIVWGRQDTVTPLDQGEAIAAAFGDARLSVLDDVNHIPHVEKPAEVVREMLDFLADAPAADDSDTANDHLRGSLATEH